MPLRRGDINLEFTHHFPYFCQLRERRNELGSSEAAGAVIAGLAANARCDVGGQGR